MKSANRLNAKAKHSFKNINACIKFMFFVDKETVILRLRSFSFWHLLGNSSVALELVGKNRKEFVKQNRLNIFNSAILGMPTKK